MFVCITIINFNFIINFIYFQITVGLFIDHTFDIPCFHVHIYEDDVVYLLGPTAGW